MTHALLKTMHDLSVGVIFFSLAAVLCVLATKAFSRFTDRLQERAEDKELQGWVAVWPEPGRFREEAVDFRGAIDAHRNAVEDREWAAVNGRWVA